MRGVRHTLALRHVTGAFLKLSLQMAPHLAERTQGEVGMEAGKDQQHDKETRLFGHHEVYTNLAVIRLKYVFKF